MANICKGICQAFGNVNHLLRLQVSRSPLFIQDRFKSRQVPFYGLKNYWPKYSMMKDQRRRMILKEYGPFKLRYYAVRKANILPPELREIAIQEMSTVPVNAQRRHITFRCLVTSKGKGNVLPFNLGRHLFRYLADYNQLSGVQRAMW